MKEFLKFIFKLSLVVSTGLFVIFLINKISINRLIKLSNDQEIYYNPKFNQSIIDFKLKKQNTHISIVGTSRTAGFEKEMFLNTSVYNYSMIAWSLEDFYNLVKEIGFSKNDTLIIGIDQWNFNKKYMYRLNNSYKKNNLNLPYVLFDELKKVNGVYLIGEKSFASFSGFRNDGSYFDGKRLIMSDEELLEANILLPPSRNNKNFNFKDDYKRIMGSEIDLNQLKFLTKILEYCKNKSIFVFGFSPPFAPSVMQLMKENKYDFTYINNSTILIRKLFDEFKFKYMDFTEYLLFDDSFYIDGSHCNRNVYFQILKDLEIPVSLNFDNSFNISKKELKLIKSYFN
ncbi:MAG: hypothetical protein ACJ0PU_02815 [Flavobacteriaceae bacterium]